MATTLSTPSGCLKPVAKQISSSGAEGWSTFGTKGVELVTHPDKSGMRVLQLNCRHKPEADWPSAAVWNFHQWR